MGNDPAGDVAHVVAFLSARKARLPFLHFFIDRENGFPAFGGDVFTGAVLGGA
jgi:hypothetical protein